MLNLFYMVENLLAKSEAKGSIGLVDHSKAVLNFSMYLFEKLFPEERMSRTNIEGDERLEFKKNLAIAAAFHDIGKCMSGFQKMLSEGGDEAPEFSHEMVSWAYIRSNIKRRNSSEAESILSSVLYHHAVSECHYSVMASDIMHYIRNDENWEAFGEFTDIMRSYMKSEFGIEVEIEKDTYDCKVGDTSLCHNMTEMNMYDFELYSQYQIIRTVLIYADRTVSGNTDLINAFLSNDVNVFDGIVRSMTELSVISWPDERLYDRERLGGQKRHLEEILSYDNVIFGANAGYGKTFIGLLWAMRNGKKVMWVVPENQIARGTYESILSELKNFTGEYKPTVSLLLAGEYEGGVGEYSDIIVTNIDNFLAPITKNGDAHNMIKLISSNVIYDEFHKFAAKAPLFLGYIGTVFTSTHFSNSKSLHLSATPSRFDLAYWNDRDDEFVYFISPEPFNGNMKVNMHFNAVGNVGDVKPTEGDTFVICNTVPQSQELDGNMVLHARFTNHDRKEKVDRLYATHGKHGNIQERKTVSATNIIGVGLDVSAHTVYDVLITPDDTIQRLCGRGGRFGEYERPLEYYGIEPTSDKGNTVRIKESYSMSLYDKWKETIKGLDGKTITKSELYEIYHKFNDDNKDDIRRMWNQFLRESCIQFRELKPYKNFGTKTDKLSSKLGFRGVNTSIYVTSRGMDGDVIIMDSEAVSPQRRSVEYTYDNRKARRKFLEARDISLKYARATRERLDESTVQLQVAKYKETPFYLMEASYDSNLGLVFN